MSLLRADFESTWTDAMPKDYTSNTLYFRTTSSIDGVLDGILWADGPDFNATAANWASQYHDMLEVNATAHTYFGVGRGVVCKLYDMAQPLPRPILGQGVIAPVDTLSERGNPAVALCFSFFGGRNLPRQRGRIFLGPMTSTGAGQEMMNATATQSIVTSVAAVLSGLQLAVPGPGTDLDVDWCVFSKKSNETHKITAAFMDTRLDVMRSRAPTPGNRYQIAATA